jgi:hypothetical protein
MHISQQSGRYKTLCAHCNDANKCAATIHRFKLTSAKRLLHLSIQTVITCVILGFCRGVNGGFAPLGSYAAQKISVIIWTQKTVFPLLTSRCDKFSFALEVSPQFSNLTTFSLSGYTKDLCKVACIFQSAYKPDFTQLKGMANKMSTNH